jgi:hypothetical protein
VAEQATTDGARRTREVLTGGGVEAGSGREPPRRRSRCGGGVREVAYPPERGEGDAAASP